MLAIFPLISLITLYLWLNRANPHWGWRRSLLRSMVIWGIWIVVSIELLSLVHGITPVGLSLAWLIFLVICMVGWVKQIRKYTSENVQQHSPINWYLLTPILAIFVTTAMIAWLAPPETYDSLNYHMSRVAHWAQNKSVAHFATGIEQQNSRPPTAEYAILHFYVLGQGDRWVNFVEWLAMFGSIIGISLLAAMLGADKSGQYLAAIFVASLPMGIIQASSTMNDYVVGIWMICVAEGFLTIWQESRNIRTIDVAFLGSAAGLAIGTKPTAFPYLLPFAIGVMINLFRKETLARLSGYVFLTLLIGAALNSGYMIRNTITYGTPIEQSQASVHINEMRNWRGLISILVKNAGLHASTPWEAVNSQLTRHILGVHFKIEVDVDDPRTTAHGNFWVRPTQFEIGESTAPNPLHAYLSVAMILLALLRFRKISRIKLVYLVLVISTFVFFCFTFKWQIFGSRYHLPFFLLLGAVFGALASSLLPKWGIYLLAIVFSVSAIWPILGNDNRPLLPLLEKATVENAFTTSHQESTYFHLTPGVNQYRQIANRIEHQNCTQILIMLGGNSPEYYWWMILGAPDPELQIEWLVAGTSSAVYHNIPPAPCAVICEGCENQDSVRDIPKVELIYPFTLYLITE